MISSRPRATMRLQFHKDFRFEDARALIPYLVDLGVSHLYSSPILTAAAGSMHGYDLIDPTRVNPELGGEQALRSLVADLRKAGLGLIVDIVPNHMAVGGSENPWWADVLRLGQKSRYATFFDIDWITADPNCQGKVLAPFLGSPYGDVLDSGDLRLTLGPDGQPVIAYFENLFPVDPADFPHVKQLGLEAFDPGNSSGRSRLHDLLERQHYRLAWWGVAGDEINWRRFFDINGLAGLRTELPEVFEESHATLFRLYAEGLVDGFRIDHVDGLSDPPGYCRRLRQRLTELQPKRPAEAAQGRAYIVVEKILGAGEQLPQDWDTDGTSGYDFMNEVSAEQHDEGGQEALERTWHHLTGRSATFEPEEVAARKEILASGFDAQLTALASALHRIARADTHTRDISLMAIRRGLAELLAHFPVYRTYHAGEKRTGYDDIAFSSALHRAQAQAPASVQAVLTYLDAWLGGVAADDYKVAQTRFQQLSAPIAAKAVEDTAFYRFGRLLSRNDVGFDAPRLGASVEDFHQACMRRLNTFPDAMLATATHDHKRGEDLRARLAVISEVPDDWDNVVARCMAIETKRPDPADEIMLYQMVVGAWPLSLDPTDKAACRAFAERLAGWQQKALREAKLKTSWAAPNQVYEGGAKDFLFTVTDPEGPFLPVLHDFVWRIAAAGAVNGLVQVALKTTAPGMPDFFQGTEFWDFSLVDPDNRRPVDYGTRIAALADKPDPAESQSTWRDGRIKQFVIRTILALRNQLPDVFAKGDYLPLTVSGAAARHVVAFIRRHHHSAVMVVVPRLVGRAPPRTAGLALDPSLFVEGILTVPPELTGKSWQPIFGGAVVTAGSSLQVGPLLDNFPIAILFLVESS